MSGVRQGFQLGLGVWGAGIAIGLGLILSPCVVLIPIGIVIQLFGG